MYKDFSVRFSNRLLDTLISSAEDDDNISLSPSRSQTVLILIANWANPDIRRRILDVVGSEVMDMDEANVLCDKSNLHLTPWKNNEEAYIPQIELNTILWLAKNLEINQAAFEEVQQWSDLSMKEVDFTQPETKATIDKVIDELTHGLIHGINADIDPMTQVLITDTLYFRARWDETFDEEDTKERLFYGTHGKIKIPMMKRQGYMPYRESATCQMVELQYMCMAEEEKTFSMRIYLPKQGHDAHEVSYELWNNEYCLDLSEEEVRSSLPKFTIEADINMNKVLSQSGLECIYESNDIMPTLSKDLQITDIAQQVKIKVNENETETAALTYMCEAGCLPPEEQPKPIVMNVNRLFLFEIAENYSNTILFTRHINNITE